MGKSNNHRKMPHHSYNKIWIHAVYATKGRAPLINSKIEKIIYNQKKAELIEMECPVRIINGMPDHVHLLFLQNPKMAITSIIKQVKGSSSHWINEQNFCEEKFAWQVGYAAFSVSESQIEKVYQYILNQKKHHKQKSFVEEYDQFISFHGVNMG
jgi:putative transposase